MSGIRLLSRKVLPTLQMGTDLRRLEDGLKYLRAVAGKQAAGQGAGDVELLGSIFLPSKRQASQCSEWLSCNCAQVTNKHFVWFRRSLHAGDRSIPLHLL